MTPSGVNGHPLLALFRQEVETNTHVLTKCLLGIERNQSIAEQLEAGMRAAHSLKGAARIVGLTAGVRIAGALEDCFVAAQQGRVALAHAQIDCLLAGIDLLKRIAATSESDLGAWDDQKSVEVDACAAALDGLLEGKDVPATPATRSETSAPRRTLRGA